MHQIVFSTDDNYAAYCGVAVSSLIENASADRQYAVDVLYTSLARHNIMRLDALSAGNVRVRCVDVSEKMEKRRVRNTQHLTAASSYSLLIAEMYPECDKVAYLDSDIVVTEDIAGFFAFELGDKVMGVVLGYLCADLGKYSFYDYVVNRLGVPADQFFNAGILLIDPKKFAEADICNTCYKMLGSRRKYEYMDQDVLNISCRGKVAFLPQKWNYEWTYTFEPTVHDDPARQAMREYEGVPAIIHYSSATKPWECPEYPMSKYFWDYARRTPFYEEIVFNNALAAFKEWQLPFEKIKKGSSVIIYGAGKVGNAYFRQIRQTNHCKVVLWCDQKYNEIRFPLGQISPPEMIYSAQFDHLVIAIAHAKTAEKTKAMFVAKGVDERKIVYGV